MFPKKLFWDKAKYCNLRRFPISEGILPGNLVFHISSSTKLIRFPIPRGIFPDILLLSRLNMVRVVEKIDNALRQLSPKVIKIVFALPLDKWHFSKNRETSCHFPLHFQAHYCLWQKPKFYLTYPKKELFHLVYFLKIEVQLDLRH